MMMVNMTPEPGDPRFELRPAELVQALASGKLALDLGNYPDADTAIYARISLDRKDRTSVERQLEIGIEHAQKQGYSFVVFLDRGKSAFRKGVFREGYEAALKAIRARRIRKLVAYKIDRMYRQVEELMDVIKIADNGRVPITLIGVDDDDRFDLTTGSGCDKAIGRVLEAQRESRKTSERIKSERLKAREKGIPSPGSPAFGWRDKLNQDPIEAEAVKQGFEAVLQGSSMRAIALRWNAAGLSGSRFTVSGVKAVLTNHRNAGRLTHTYVTYDDQGERHKVTEIVKEDVFTPIVDRETFDAVQRILKQRGVPRVLPRRRGMLTGLVCCALCGKVMRRAHNRGNLIYRCNLGTHEGEGCCLTIRASHLEPFVEDALFRYLDSPDFRQRVEDRKEVGTRRAELTAERDRLTRKREVLRRSMLASEDDDDLDGYQDDVRALSAELRRIESELSLFQPMKPAEQWIGNGAGLHETWPNLDTDQRREIIKDAFERITVKPARRLGRAFDATRIELGASS